MSRSKKSGFLKYNVTIELSDQKEKRADVEEWQAVEKSLPVMLLNLTNPSISENGGRR